MFENFFTATEEHWTMQKLQNDATTFNYFDYARYATDVTFQQSNCPSGNILKGKKYFSDKHKMFGLKIEPFVLPIGICIGWTKHWPGSISDLKIVCQKDFFFNEASKKATRDLEVFDEGLLQICSLTIGKFRPIKDTKVQQKHFEWFIQRKLFKVLHYRQQIKIWIGKFHWIGLWWKMFLGVCALFGLLFYTIGDGAKIYTTFFKIAVSLTNFHDKKLAWHEEDQEYFCGIRSLFWSISVEILKERKRKQEKYVSRRLQLCNQL